MLLLGNFIKLNNNMKIYLKTKQISEGFFNLFLSTFYKLKNRKLYNERLTICLNCEYLLKEKKIKRCSICGCFIKAKTKVNYKLDENNKSIICWRM
jgi:uncharacterized paraquat-inducible protein A